MKTRKYFILILTGLFLLITLFFNCVSTKKTIDIPKKDSLMLNQDAKGYQLEINFKKGSAHNYPLMAIWIEDTNGVYLQTLYVAESIAKGVFKKGQVSEGKWMPGPIRRPAALPYWAFSRGVKEADGLYVPTEKTPVADAYTGATPTGNFVLRTKTEDQSVSVFNIYFEINQTWDWNEYWTNNKFPDDEDYKTSCQPALVYSSRIDISKPQNEYNLKLIGHSHYSGKDGRLYSDLSTITTALNIADKIVVKIIR
ncbi:MAG: hypothetical protein JXJ22_11290 [Bacteroidales bacterium]|nr:hypothetical protein [Bacteroidales bacterium]